MCNQLTDVIFAMSLFYSSADLAMQWWNYASCARPLHVWLLVSFISALGYRALHGWLKARYMAALSFSPLDDDDTTWYEQWVTLHFAANSQPWEGLIRRVREPEPASAPPEPAGQQVSLMWKTRITQYGLALPLFIGWTIVGTVWVRDVAVQSPACLPEDTQAWFPTLWLCTCYFIVFWEFACLFCAITHSSRARAFVLGLEHLELSDMYARWGEHLFSGYPHAGMRPDEITDMIEGEKVRQLAACHHMFHQG